MKNQAGKLAAYISRTIMLAARSRRARKIESGTRGTRATVAST